MFGERFINDKLMRKIAIKEDKKRENILIKDTDEWLRLKQVAPSV